MTFAALVVAGYASMALWSPDSIDFIAGRTGLLRHALIIHGASGALALALGPFQFIGTLRQVRPVLHKSVGSVYLVCVLLSGVTGLSLASTTPGGMPASAGFFTLALLWLLTGAAALRAARVRNFVAHRAWMLRSYALTFGAVTLRVYLGAGVALGGLPFDDVYATAAWASWVINLLIVEWVLLRRPLLSSGLQPA